MVTINEFIGKIDIVAKAFNELLVAIAAELPEIKEQLEAAINGNLNTGEAMEALEKLKEMEAKLPGAIEQVKGFAPTIVTPNPGDDPEAPIEENPVPDIPDVEIPVVVDENDNSAGMDGVPNMDFPQVV